MPESKQNKSVPAGWSITRPVGLQVGEGQTGDRLIADAIEPFRRQLELARSERRVQGAEALKPLSHLAAETRGAGLLRE